MNSDRTDHRLHSRTAPVPTAIFCAAIPLVLLANLVLAQASAHEADPTAFLVKYRQAQRDLLTAFANARIEGTRWARVPTRESPESPVRFEERSAISFIYIRGGGCDELRFRDQAPKFVENVFVVAEKRGFAVRRFEPGGPFSLQGMFQPDDPPQVVREYRAMRRAPICPLRCADFATWVGSREFTVHRISRELMDGGGVLRASFDYQPGGKDEPRASGWFCVDPSIGWALRSYEFDVRRVGRPVVRYSGSIVYDKTHGELYRPTLTAANARVVTRTTHFSLYTRYRVLFLGPPTQASSRSPPSA